MMREGEIPTWGPHFSLGGAELNPHWAEFWVLQKKYLLILLLLWIPKLYQLPPRFWRPSLAASDSPLPNLTIDLHRQNQPHRRDSATLTWMHCAKTRRHALWAPIRHVLTWPDSRCDRARAQSSPALESQKPWRHPSWCICKAKYVSLSYVSLISQG